MSSSLLTFSSLIIIVIIIIVLYILWKKRKNTTKKQSTIRRRAMVSNHRCAVLTASWGCSIDFEPSEISFCTSQFKAISSLLTLNGPRSTWLVLITSPPRLPLHNFLMSIFSSDKVTNAARKAEERLQKCKQN